MPSSVECRARAEQKLAQAKHDKRNSRKLIAAAQGWLLLARGTAEIERSYIKKSSIAVENDTVRADLRALMSFTQATLTDYADDPTVQCRVGRMLANIPAGIRINSIGDTWH